MRNPHDIYDCHDDCDVIYVRHEECHNILPENNKLITSTFVMTIVLTFTYYATRTCILFCRIMSSVQLSPHP